MTTAEAVRLQYADVGLTCACGGTHGAHYDLRTDTGWVGTGCDHCASCTSLRWQTASAAPQPEPVFAAYRQILRDQATLPPAEWTFKRDPRYQQFLEHVSPQQGEAYLAWMRVYVPRWSPAVEALVCQAALDNDALGTPLQASSDLGITCSPTNLRYAWQAVEVLHHATTVLGLTETHVVEVGGGYGGLALFLQRLAPEYGITVASHVIADVPEAGPLQQAYAQALGLRNVWPVDGTDGEALERTVRDPLPNRLFVSAYGFSELNAELRWWYERTLVRHCPHGWLAWNRCAPYQMVPGALVIRDEPVPTETGVKVVTY